MAFCRGRDFLFCSMCGTLLRMKTPEFAECPLCGFKRDACEIEGKEVCYTVTAEVNESCPRCNNPQLEYYTNQLRSADERQTVFYDCRKCGYKYSLNA